MSVKYTKTATFLFPLLKIPKSLFACDVRNLTGYLKFNDRFLNAYIGDNSINKYQKDHVFLLLRNYRDVAFDEFYQKLIKLDNYVEDYEVNNCLIAIFSIPEEHKEDYNQIINGKYSKVSKKGRETIIKNKYCSIPTSDAVIEMIFNKAPSLREHWEKEINKVMLDNQYISLDDSEVWPIINEKDILCKETYDKYSKVTNYKQKGKIV